MTLALTESIESIIGRLYAPPRNRRGDHSGRLWWVCPFHGDRNPSLSVVPGASHYHCFGCGAHGDAIDFVRQINSGLPFREAVKLIEGGDPMSPAHGRHQPQATPPRPLIERPEGWQEFVRNIVATAERILWSDRGMEAREYLAGRGLTETTIREARLGFWPVEKWFAGIFADRRIWVPCGIFIPGFDGPDVAIVNVRRLEGDPKYVAIRGSRRGGLYSGRQGIFIGKPLVIVEGEFDALLLGQALGDSATVVTLGGAGNKPSSRILNAMLAASPWIVAVDNDQAGVKAADSWMPRSDRCVRVVPPAGMGKDWSEAHQRGLDLEGWWRRTLNRVMGRSARSGGIAPTPAALPSHINTISEGFNLVDGVLLTDPTPCPWRKSVGDWPVDWRARWGGRANDYSHEGLDWRRAESRAAIEVAAEMADARGGPSPVMDPDPRDTLWRDFLVEMIASGEAARSLSPAQLAQAEDQLKARPLDHEAIRRVVRSIRSRDRIERNRAYGIPETFTEDRWRCLNRFCRNKTRWWMSEYGVINCSNCRAPQFPGLVVLEGDFTDAPLVDPNCSKQALFPPPCRQPSPSISALTIEPTTCVCTP